MEINFVIKLLEIKKMLIEKVSAINHTPPLPSLMSRVMLLYVFFVLITAINWPLSAVTPCCCQY